VVKDASGVVVATIHCRDDLQKWSFGQQANFRRGQAHCCRLSARPRVHDGAARLLRTGSGQLAVYDEPQIIAERRNSDLSRTRPQRTAKQLEEHQARSEKVGAEYATRLNIPFIRVRAGDAQALADAICSLTGNGNHLITG
jgi:adenylate kinase